MCLSPPGLLKQTPQMNWLIHNRYLFIMVLEAGSPGSGVSMDGLVESSSKQYPELLLAPPLGREPPKALTAIIRPHTKVKTTESMFQTVSFSGLFAAFKNKIDYIYFQFFSKLLFSREVMSLCDPMDCSPPGSSVRGISQARILECTATFFSRRSSQSRN